MKVTSFLTGYGEAAGGEAMPASGWRHPRTMDRNKVLARMDEEQLERLRPHLEWTTLEPGEVLTWPDAPVPYVWFPTAGAVAVLATERHAPALGIDLVGREGLIGWPALLGRHNPLLQAAVVFAGGAYRIDAATLRGLADENAALRALLLAEVNAFAAQAAQAAACAARHTLRRRLAHWLLLAQRRTGEAELAVTHGMMAQILSVRRPGVTTALNELESKGIVRARYGRIVIVQQEELERIACGCRDLSATGLACPPGVNGESPRPSLADGDGSQRRRCFQPFRMI